MVSRLTATESEQMTAANREKLAPTIGDRLRSMISSYRRSGNSPQRIQNTIRNIELHALPCDIATRRVDVVTKDELQDYVNGLKGEPSTFEPVFQWFAKLFEEAIDDGLMRRNPWKKVRLPKKTTKTEPPRFTPEHLITICTERGSDFFPVWRAFAGLLVRPGELLHQRIEDIHLNGKPPHLWVRYSHQGATKGGEPRKLPIFRFVRPALDELIDGRSEGPLLMNPKTGKRWGAGHIRDMLRQDLKALDLDGHGYTLKAFRRAGGDAMLNGDWGKKVPIEIVSAMYGHKDSSTTRIYCGIKDRTLLAYADLLDIDVALIEQSGHRTSSVAQRSQR